MDVTLVRLTLTMTNSSSISTTKMKLTCVTAVFNAIKSGNRENLIRCVRSVAALKTEHEHLIYDGASTDGTVELLREFEANTPGLKVVSEPDTGLYNALNKGVRDAKGEWFYVLGCDDYICHPEVMDNLIRNIPREVQVSISTVLQGGDPWFTNLTALRKLFFRSPYIHQGFLIRIGVVRELDGFDERWIISSDWDQSWKLHMGGYNIQYSFEPYAYFATGGLSSDWGRLSIDFYGILKKHLRLTDAEVKRVKEKWRLPTHTCLHFLFNRDYALRSSARYCLFVNIRDVFALLLFPLVVIARPLCRKLNIKVWPSCE